MHIEIGDMKRTTSSVERGGQNREQSPEPVSMVVEGKEDESIFTKDERSVRYERIHKIA